jgi:hypothetical protein
MHKQTFFFRLGIFSFAVFLWAFGFSGPAFAQQVFTNLPDVPMMPGMKEQPGGSPGTATATIPDKQNAILSFYDQRLVSEGWVTTDAHHMVYKKEGKTIQITATTEKDVTTVVFAETSEAPAGGQENTQGQNVQGGGMPGDAGSQQPAPDYNSSPPDQQQPPAYSQ